MTKKFTQLIENKIKDHDKFFHSPAVDIGFNEVKQFKTFFGGLTTVLIGPLIFYVFIR